MKKIDLICRILGHQLLKERFDKSSNAYEWFPIDYCTTCGLTEKELKN